MKKITAALLIFLSLVYAFYQYLVYHSGGILALVLGVILIGAGILEAKAFKKFKQERPEDIPLSPELAEEEYHNDFSRVPAGERDEHQPLPREISYGVSLGDKTVIEDLEKIGIIETDKNKKRPD